ncbi:MAG: hypothetical protein Q9173_007377, partial [Seirophora scorigena]
PAVKAMKADDLFCDNPNDIREGFTINPGWDRGTPPPPMIKDDSEMRQSEFEAHLNRQQGGGAKKGEEDANPKGEPAAEKASNVAEEGAVTEPKKVEDEDAAKRKEDEDEVPASENTKVDGGGKKGPKGPKKDDGDVGPASASSKLDGEGPKKEGDRDMKEGKKNTNDKRRDDEKKEKKGEEEKPRGW